MLPSSWVYNKGILNVHVMGKCGHTAQFRLCLFSPLLSPTVISLSHLIWGNHPVNTGIIVSIQNVCACCVVYYLPVISCCRSLSVSSVSSVSSASSSSSSVRSADSDDMYADLASPVSSASSRSPTPNHPRKEQGPARDRPPHGRDKNRG